MSAQTARDGGERVAVTGVGVVSPIGIGRHQFWSALCAGRSGIAPVEGLARASGLPRIAASVGEFAAKALIASPQFRRMDRLSRMAVAASRLALDDAAIASTAMAGERGGVVFGSAVGDLEDSVAHLHRVFTRGPAAASPMVFPNLVMNAPAGYIAMEYGLTGVNFTVAQHEISGEHAIGLGADLIRGGRAEVVLAGGGDQLSAILVAAYHRSRALAAQRGGREWASPYDRDRSGIVLGEGAAVLVLEPLVAARARRARIYAELSEDVAYAVPSPRYDWPRHVGAGGEPLPRVAVHRDGIDLVLGAANSSRRLDAWELETFAGALAERAGDVFITSIKGAIGEFGAAGALTAAAACLSLHERAVPPLCHLRSVPAGTPFRVAAPHALSVPVRSALVSGLARGGSAIALRFDAVD